MLDLNKYLQDQLSLAKQKNESKKLTQKNIVSEKSMNTAEAISRKQNQIRTITKTSNNDVSVRTLKSSTSKEENSDGSEYIPSDDDDDDDEKDPIMPSIIKINTRNTVKKIIDDGDTKLFKARIEKWQNDLRSALNGTYVGPVTSADIKHVLSNKVTDALQFHELQNGLKIPQYIWSQLYKYQKVGVKWLWELYQIQAGGLLGDEMGLGKTVQIIAFLGGLSKSDIGIWNGLGPSVIVAPATVIYQWVSHFHYWCPHLRVAVLHHSGSHSGNHDRLIRDINHAHGILLITYAGIVKYNKALTGWKWHYCILDEGHKIRNPETQVSKLLRKFPTQYRILITGSPMQNSLMELWSLYDFIRPGLLGTQNAFMEHFALPITQGGYANATEFQEAVGLEVAKALKDMITPYMLRRTKAEVQDHIKLPEKNEQVLFCSLTKEQRDLYMGYLMSGTVRSILDRESRYGEPLRARILVALSTLRKICNHPDLYLYEAQETTNVIDEEQFGNWKRSGKMTVVQSLLKLWQKQEHRALIFTQSRAMLCILEQHLQNQKYKYLKMDGTVSVSQRQSLIKNFNDDSSYLVFLATTRVGGLGVNLTGADRVIIYDPDWNPATDTQAKERAWRIGQLRNVTVYRLLSVGTIEEKIYQRQVFKHLLSNKVLVDANQKNIITTSTLQGLFSLEEPNSDGDTETSSIFKHTKVNLKQSYNLKDSIHLSGSVSFSQQKLDAMRKMAKEISKKIVQNTVSKKVEESQVTNKKTEICEDPRERYRKKRDIMINPPKIEVPEVNIVDDKVTNIPFENVLSELDIVNMHTKQNYEENFICEVLKQQDIEEGEIVELESTNNEIIEDDNKIIEQNNKNAIKLKDNYKKRKRMSTVQKIKKIKKKKINMIKNTEIVNDDDYVLSKLFAKSAVKNALQHDEIVGLAEKEKRYKLKEEAARKARDAVRAIKCSAK